MKIGKWIAAIAATILLSSGGIAFAQGKGHGKGHDKHGTHCRPALQRRIVYRRGWKGNSFAAGRFPQDSRSGSSLVLKSSNGSYLPLLPTALIW